MVDFARRRLTMVETQLRPNEVTDARLIAAMSALLFLDSKSRKGVA